MLGFFNNWKYRGTVENQKRQIGITQWTRYITYYSVQVISDNYLFFLCLEKLILSFIVEIS